jgi:lysine biosynthesis protein LysW
MQNNAICPECDAEVKFSNTPFIDQRTLCPRCGSDLIVIRTNPFVLDWAFVEPLSRPERSEYLDVTPIQTWNES